MYPITTLLEIGNFSSHDKFSQKFLLNSIFSIIKNCYKLVWIVTNNYIPNIKLRIVVVAYQGYAWFKLPDLKKFI